LYISFKKNVKHPLFQLNFETKIIKKGVPALCGLKKYLKYDIWTIYNKQKDI